MLLITTLQINNVVRYSAVVRRKVGGFTGSVVDSYPPERVAEDKERMIENATPGVVKNGVEAYNYDENDKLVDLKAIYFVPETHPVFNLYAFDLMVEQIFDLLPGDGIDYMSDAEDIVFKQIFNA